MNKELEDRYMASLARVAVSRRELDRLGESVEPLTEGGPPPISQELLEAQREAADAAKECYEAGKAYWRVKGKFLDG
ncbi:hypothetical protein [Actinokineospora sp.]|uniref:hypothetical protein n=1 Tax=Actinokineospora sp. TaxID=1872133 RepID=UPI003D6B132B